MSESPSSSEIPDCQDAPENPDHETKQPKFGSAFWKVLILLSFFVFTKAALQLLRKETVEGPWEASGWNWKEIYTAIGMGSLIFTGSVSDWLGLRRSFLYTFAALVVWFLGMGLVLAVVGDSTPTSVWSVFFIGLGILLHLRILLEYRGVRRFTSPKWRVQGILLGSLILPSIITMVGLSIEYPLAGFVGIPPFHSDPPGSIVSYAGIVFLLVVFGLAFGLWWSSRLPKNEVQFGDEQPLPGMASKPTGPFAGIRDVLTLGATRRVLLLAVISFLLDSTMNGYSVLLSDEAFGLLENQHNALSFSIMLVLPYLVVLFVFLPLARRISIKATIQLSAILILISILLFLVPLDGSAYHNLCFTGIFFLNLGSTLLWIRSLEFTMNLAPVGREGSLVSVLAVWWLVEHFLHSGQVKLVEAQKSAAWALELRDRINPDMSHVVVPWLVLLVPVLAGIFLLFRFQRFLFLEEEKG